MNDRKPRRRFDHVLLTRFSAVLGPGAPPATSEWLRYRLGFFYDACYASVTRQHGASFDWLVLFDDRCSDAFRAEVEEMARGAFTPVWTHERFRRDSFAGPVAEITSPAAPYLMTTRIDSDDAIAVDFMAAVQAQFTEQDGMFVGFPRGLQIDRSGAVYRTDVLSSPFITLVERRRPDRLPRTVYEAKHARARAHGPVREVAAPPMWAQVVHDANLSNIVNGVRVSPAVVRRRFDLDLTYDEDISGARLAAARARQMGRLASLWAHHPGELTKFVEAAAWGLRGTHERAQDDGRTLSDRAQRLEREVGARWRASATYARVRDGARVLRRAGWARRGWANRVLPSRHRVVGDLAGALGSARVAVVAEYSRHATPRESTLRLAAALADVGWGTLVVSARDPWVRLRVPELPARTAVLRRPNLGYDFGSWSAALAAYPTLADKERVLLTNDSLVGPLEPLAGLLARVDDADADVWGATWRDHPVPHLQSFFLVFSGGVLSREPLRGFFAAVAHVGSKEEVVRCYELGLSRVARDAGLRLASGWTPRALGLTARSDPSIVGWLPLLDDGFPFVKRALLARREFADAGWQVADLVGKRYGVDVTRL